MKKNNPNVQINQYLLSNVLKNINGNEIDGGLLVMPPQQDNNTIQDSKQSKNLKNDHYQMDEMLLKHDMQHQSQEMLTSLPDSLPHAFSNFEDTYLNMIKSQPLLGGNDMTSNFNQLMENVDNDSNIFNFLSNNVNNTSIDSSLMHINSSWVPDKIRSGQDLENMSVTNESLQRYNLMTNAANEAILNESYNQISESQISNSMPNSVDLTTFYANSPLTNLNTNLNSFNNDYNSNKFIANFNQGLQFINQTQQNLNLFNNNNKDKDNAINNKNNNDPKNQNIGSSSGANLFTIDDDIIENKYRSSSHSNINFMNNFVGSNEDPKIVYKRAVHNNVERRRRDVINECIKELSELIQPYQYSGRRNKGSILRFTVEYIKKCQKDEANLKELEIRVAQLERENTNFRLNIKDMKYFIASNGLNNELDKFFNINKNN